ncbi:MAG: DUF697 domain-containing protein [Pseudomonadota bacterium]
MLHKTEESQAVPPPVCTTEKCTDLATRSERLDRLARNHILAASGVGLVPIPIVDIAGVMGVHLDLIKKLSDEYNVPFDKSRGKTILTALLGGLFPVAIAGTVMSLLKFIPVIGQTAGAVTLPVLFGASTYAVHKVFVLHYEAGGTLLDLNPAKMKQYFSEQFLAGKSVAANMRESTAKNSS